MNQYTLTNMEKEIYAKLRKADKEIMQNTKRYSLEEVLQSINDIIK